MKHLKNKTVFLLCLFFALCTANSLAQTRLTRQPIRGHMPTQRLSREQIKREFDQFIIKAASLTPKESQDFLTLYHAMRDKLRSIQTKIQRASSRVEAERLPEQDCQIILNEILRLKKQYSEIESGYYQQFKSVLPARKLIKVMSAEREFGRNMFRNGARR